MDTARAWVEERLEKHGISQAKLAGYVGIDPSQLTRMLDKHQGLRLYRIKKIARFFQEDEGELLRVFGLNGSNKFTGATTPEELMQLKGIKNGELSTRAGVDKSIITRMTRGQKSLSVEAANKIAVALDVDVRHVYNICLSKVNRNRTECGYPIPGQILTNAEINRIYSTNGYDLVRTHNGVGGARDIVLFYSEPYSIVSFIDGIITFQVTKRDPGQYRQRFERLCRKNSSDTVSLFHKVGNGGKFICRVSVIDRTSDSLLAKFDIDENLDEHNIYEILEDIGVIRNHLNELYSIALQGSRAFSAQSRS